MAEEWNTLKYRYDELINWKMLRSQFNKLVFLIVSSVC